MGVKQGIIAKKTARNKNKKPKYSFLITKETSQTKQNGTTTKKFAYTKKVLINGKYRYYYS